MKNTGLSLLGAFGLFLGGRLLWKAVTKKGKP